MPRANSPELVVESTAHEIMSLGIDRSDVRFPVESWSEEEEEEGGLGGGEGEGEVDVRGGDVEGEEPFSDILYIQPSSLGYN